MILTAQVVQTKLAVDDFILALEEYEKINSQTAAVNKAYNDAKNDLDMAKEDYQFCLDLYDL